MPRLLLVLLPTVSVLVAACGDEDARSPDGPTEEAVASSSPAPSSPSPATPTPIPAITLAAAGDVMLGRSIGEGIQREGPSYPFQFVSGLPRQADVAFVNLEAPITAGGEPATKDFVFRAPPAGAQALTLAGVDIVSLANNHMLDYGVMGLEDTLAALDAAAVLYAGAGPDVTAARAPAIVERNGLRLAFLAYANTPADSGTGFDVSATQATADRPGIAWLSPEAVAEDVAGARQQADIVIVSMHTGLEYQVAVSDLQNAAAHAAVDAGAALVLGHHPHVLQRIESYKGALIAYSLGNFVFDFDFVDYSVPGLPSALSAVLSVTLGRQGVLECSLVPIIIGRADGLPRPAEGPDAEQVLDRLRRLSDGSCGLGPE